jgi:REP element-mobilizing transposase RayT
MGDPLAYFITWTTYGTWLPGDARGWTKKQLGGIQPPDPVREAAARRLMTEDAVILSTDQRAIVDKVILDHCRIRGWTLHARNVRTNHVHVVATASHIDPEIVREQLKAWASRRLSEHAGLKGTGKHGKRRWWTEGGDIEGIGTEDQLRDVIITSRKRNKPEAQASGRDAGCSGRFGVSLLTSRLRFGLGSATSRLRFGLDRLVIRSSRLTVPPIPDLRRVRFMHAPAVRFQVVQRWASSSWARRV